jgi:hypothetical protein
MDTEFIIKNCTFDISHIFDIITLSNENWDCIINTDKCIIFHHYDTSNQIIISHNNDNEIHCSIPLSLNPNNNTQYLKIFNIFDDSDLLYDILTKGCNYNETQKINCLYSNLILDISRYIKKHIDIYIDTDYYI